MLSNSVLDGPGVEGQELMEKGWIVQKFGGTSVGKFAITIVEDIVRCVT